jgi:hypothetical protein
VRDWQAWHDDYGDPRSELSRRLLVVQQAIRTWLDARPPGPQRVLSLCAGQGQDVVGALRGHPRREEVTGLLVELDPRNVAVAEDALWEAGLRGLAAVAADAGCTSGLVAHAPADLVLVCGVFGNVTDDDAHRTVNALPALCAAAGTVIWTRHRRAPDLTPMIRSWLDTAGFEEVAFTSPGPDSFAVGVHRFARLGPPAGGLPDRLFTFVR